MAKATKPGKCCGKPIRTPFCPRCGRRAKGGSPLLELLQHLHGRLDSAMSRERTMRERLTVPHIRSARESSRGIENAILLQQKYSRWIAAMEKVMA